MQTSRAKASLSDLFPAESPELILKSCFCQGTLAQESPPNTLWWPFCSFMENHKVDCSIPPSLYGLCSNADAFVESHGLRMVVWSLTHIRWPSLTPELWDPNKDSGENTAGFQLEYSFHRYLASQLAFSQQYSGTAIVAQIKLRIGSTPSVATVISFLLSY